MKNRKKYKARKARKWLQTNSGISKAKKKSINDTSDSDSESDSGNNADHELPELKEDDDRAWNNLYRSLIPSAEDIRIREKVVTRIESVVKKANKNYELELYGSSHSGLVLKRGDLDFSVNVEGDNVNPQSICERIKKLMDRDNLFSRIKLVTVGEKLKFHGQCKEEGVRIAFDISVNNIYATFSSRFLKAVLTNNLPIVQKLLILLKSFFKNKLGGVNKVASTVICYLVVFFLQQKKVIPCLLRTDFPGDAKQFVDEAKEYELKVCDKTVHASRTVTSLLIEFFEYYLAHDFNKYAVSLRKNSVIRKRTLNWHYRKDEQKFCVAIMDPFQKRENVGKGISKNVLENILTAFKEASNDLKAGKSVEVFE